MIGRSVVIGTCLKGRKSIMQIIFNIYCDVNTSLAIKIRTEMINGVN